MCEESWSKAPGGFGAELAKHLEVKCKIPVGLVRTNNL